MFALLKWQYDLSKRLEARNYPKQKGIITSDDGSGEPTRPCGDAAKRGLFCCTQQGWDGSGFDEGVLRGGEYVVGGKKTF